MATPSPPAIRRWFFRSAEDFASAPPRAPISRFLVQHCLGIPLLPLRPYLATLLIAGASGRPQPKHPLSALTAAARARSASAHLRLKQNFQFMPPRLPLP